MFRALEQAAIVPLAGIIGEWGPRLTLKGLPQRGFVPGGFWEVHWGCDSNPCEDEQSIQTPRCQWILAFA